MSVPPHIPVLLREVLDVLTPRDGAVYVDATFGAGGYSAAFLEAAQCTVWGVDRDPDAVGRAEGLMQRYPGRLTVIKGCYGDLTQLLAGAGVRAVDGIAFDLGVSSMQLDEPGRGFTFRADGPLDMRMSQDGLTAADVANELAEKELADIIYKYGEERASRRIARTIAQARGEAPITRTGQLADLVRRAIPRARDGIDPATRTFQALRIYVNDELGDLEQGLRAAETLLAPGGRLCVVSFHSLEDRIVKDFLRRRSGGRPRPSRHLPETPDVSPEPTFRLLQKRAVTPGRDETAANPRARSARLRAAERTPAPAWPGPDGQDTWRRAA